MFTIKCDNHAKLAYSIEPLSEEEKQRMEGMKEEYLRIIKEVVEAIKADEEIMGLIERIKQHKWVRVIEGAESWLEEAERSLNNDLYDSCLISSYLAMFHSARAVLFREGGERRAISVLPGILKRCMLKRANLKGSGLICSTG